MSGNSQKLLILQPRDRKLLSELAVMRVIDRELAQAVAGFDSITRANARLLALTQAGYLRRSFVGTISGGRKGVYRLSVKGFAIGTGVAQNAGKDYSELFLEHQLLVNQVYLQVRHRPIPIMRCEFKRWINFTRVLSRISTIIPDGYFELNHDSVIKPMFLEVDLGTEALKIWQRKINGYLKLAVTGEFQKLFRQMQFKVIVIATTQRRVESIRNLAAKFTDKIFRFTSFDTINREGFWSPVWRKPTGDQKEPLL
jgi:hypothetical protein